MPVRITMSAETLGRSRFAISPVHEVVGVIRRRGRHPAVHARAWYRRAREAMPPGLLAVLEALVPDDHVNTPDFLTEPPQRSVETIEEAVERIAATPPDVVDYHLDVGLRGRTMWPDVVAFYGDQQTYEQWRRPVPPALADLLDHGPDVVARTSAEAILTFFDVAVRADWTLVREILVHDIRRRSDRMAAHGAVSMLDDLGDGMTWTGTGVCLDRPFDGTIDWADDGLLLVPSTTHVGPVTFAAERPLTPMIGFRADGIAVLGERGAQRGGGEATSDLIGPTRATLLELLTEPRSTAELSQLTFWAESTVSYHLKILLRSGLVDQYRRGRRVLYQRTRLGSALVDGSREG